MYYDESGEAHFRKRSPNLSPADIRDNDQLQCRHADKLNGIIFCLPRTVRQFLFRYLFRGAVPSVGR